MKTNRIPLRGADNARDLGGMVNASGQAITSGRFLRSNSLQHLGRQDIALLAGDYRVARIIDLRTATEVRDKPDVTIPGSQWIHIPLLAESTFGITHETGNDQRASLLDRLPDMPDLYRHIVTDAYSLSQLKRVFLEIACEAEGAVLWHCTEGKDRCGIVTALLLALLEVDEAAIMADYLQTNLAAKKRARSYFWKVFIFTRTLTKARKIRRMFLADPTYLQAAWDAIRQRHGSISAFMAEELAMGPDQVATLRRMALRNTAQ